MSSDIITKAVRLLHSPSKESAEQLKALLESCQSQKKISNTKQAPLNKKIPATSITVPTIINPAVDAKPQPMSDIEACIACKLTTRTTNNQMVECQECHNLYHQECHKPTLTDQNISDPRYVWYCSQCIQARKKAKLMAKTKTKTTPTVEDVTIEKNQTKVSTSSSGTSFFSPWPLPSARWNSGATSKETNAGSKKSDTSKQSNDSS